MTRRVLPLDGPFDLPGTLAPLVRGHGDRTIRIASREAWWATRTAAGPATLHLSLAPGTLTAEAWGPGADLLRRHRVPMPASGSCPPRRPSPRSPTTPTTRSGWNGGARS